MNVLKTSLPKLDLRQFDPLLPGLLTIFFCLVMLLSTSQLAAELERDSAQAPVSLTDLAKFNKAEKDAPQPGEALSVVEPSLSAQIAEDSEASA